MLKLLFQMHIIFLFCVIIRLNDAILQEHAAGEATTLSDIRPRSNCTAEYCTCSEIPQWNNVECKIDFWSDHSALHFSSSEYLPTRMFQGLSIYSVTLKDPNITVAEDFLEGMLRLHEFKAEKSSIKVIPDFSLVSDSIATIIISSSLLTSLGGQHLQNLTKMWDLTFTHNFIQYIDPDFFKGTENIEWLHLDYNLLSYIPPKLIDPMKKLVKFSVSHNNLLHVNELFYVIRPQYIDLAFNNITNFSSVQLFNLEKYQDFIKFDVWVLDLSYNFIKEAPMSLSTCNLNHDSIPEIRKLNLNGNQLLDLNDYLRCIHCNTLEIIGNQIKYLTVKDFMSVYKIEEFLLRENQIQRIDTDTFKRFNTSLQKLDLSSNKIISVNGSVKYLYNLRSLNLSHNLIQTIAEDEFTDLLLSRLYLEHNQIKSLGTTLQEIGILNVLNINHNDINFIKPEQLPYIMESIYLADNPLICGCKNLPLIDMLKDDRENKMCLRSKHEKGLRKHLNCPERCSCKCAEYENGLSMFVDCSSSNLSGVPHFMENNLAQMENKEMLSSDDQRYRVMYQNINPSLHLEDNVLGISLENNRLEVLDAAKLPPNLVQLYLSNNNFRRFPLSVFDSQLNLQQVSLSGNPWKCDCEALKFKKWLTSNINITKDADNIRCGMSDKGEKDLNGSIIWKLNEVDLCPEIDLVLIFSVSFGALFFIAVCLFARLIYSKYELNIKVSLYSHGFTLVKEEVLEQDKAFDAFISFCHIDDEFVIRDIITEIENRDPNIRLCLHYRHFRPGEPIVDNIAHAVQKSKRTVFILSRNFLESEWCLLEFKTAHIQTLRDKIHRVIAVKIEELPKDIDPLVGVYLKSTTYLTWGESNFWNKLFHILPSRSTEKSPVLRFVGDNETVC